MPKYSAYICSIIPHICSQLTCTSKFAVPPEAIGGGVVPQLQQSYGNSDTDCWEEAELVKISCICVERMREKSYGTVTWHKQLGWNGCARRGGDCHNTGRV